MMMELTMLTRVALVLMSIFGFTSILRCEMSDEGMIRFLIACQKEKYAKKFGKDRKQVPDRRLKIFDSHTLSNGEVVWIENIL